MSSPGAQTIAMMVTSEAQLQPPNAGRRAERATES